MNARDYESAIQTEVAEWPGVSVRFEEGGKHPRAIFAFGDAEQFRPYPGTPSDSSRGLVMKITEVRRMLREMGAERKERPKSTRPPSERNPGADMREMPGGEPAPVRPDPWAALRPMASAPLITAPGIYALDAATYHADPAPEPSLSATLAKLIVGKSPRHAWCASPRLNPDWQPTDRKLFDIGRAAHRAVLGAGADYEAIPDELLASNGAVSTKEAKAFVAEARDRGRTPLKTDEVEQIERMRSIAARRLAEHGVSINPSRSELVALAQIEGVWCRAMYDNVPTDPRLPIYDFKTCEDASPQACLRSIVNYGYDIQAAHYRAVWKAVTGEGRGFTFIFQEKPEPHEVTLITLSGSFQDLGQNRADRARRLWGECVTTGEWPGYPAGLHEVDPPAWLIDREYQEAA